MYTIPKHERVALERTSAFSGITGEPSETQRAPRVSVVIPTYNSARFLREAIQSVLNQTYSDFEVVIIDDGSTDDTESVVRSFGERVSYVKQPNRGVSAARNQGIRDAKAEYVAFLDSDDIWLPNKLAEQIPLLEQDPELGLVYSDWAVVPEHGEAEPSFLKKVPGSSGHVFEALLQWGFILTSGTVVRRACLDEVGYFDETLSIAQDYDLWLRISYRWKVALVSKSLLIKRNWDGNLSSNFLKTATERIALFKKVLKDFPDITPRHRQLVRHQLSLSYWDVGYDQFEHLLLGQARKNFALSLTCNWKNMRALGYLAVSCLPGTFANTVRAVKRRVL
jgi:glycosyltransferase involved in cell wall biosynthesis